jgi:hypothetical protein
MKQKEIIIDHLKAMGFDPIELGNAGYIFKYEDMNYLYMPEEDDEQFLRIAIPHLFDVTDENRVAVLKAMHETGLMLKYTKMCIMFEDTIWAIYEHRLNNSDNLTELLEHIIRFLEATVYVFNQKINGEDIRSSSEENSENELEAELQKILESEEDE